MYYMYIVYVLYMYSDFLVSVLYRNTKLLRILQI